MVTRWKKVAGGRIRRDGQRRYGTEEDCCCPGPLPCNICFDDIADSTVTVEVSGVVDRTATDCGCETLDGLYVLSGTPVNCGFQCYWYNAFPNPGMVCATDIDVDIGVAFAMQLRPPFFNIIDMGVQIEVFRSGGIGFSLEAGFVASIPATELACSDTEYTLVGADTSPGVISSVGCFQPVTPTFGSLRCIEGPGSFATVRFGA